jgi:hypothetical protein
MGESHSPDNYESALDRHLPPREQKVRAMSRRIFREMVKDEICDRPLGWRRRRQYLAYAAKLNIDPFEARLLIRGVEYECGHVKPAAMDNPRSDIEAEYLSTTQGQERLLDRMMMVPALAAGLLLLTWLLVAE